MRPDHLKSGDAISIVAPSGRVNREYIGESVHIFESWGLQVRLGKNLFKDYNQFSGTDAHRLEDLQEALDGESKAIICARGGYGATRIVDEVDLTKFRHNPKWLVGYSDITTLHFLLSQEKIESVHGIMPSQMSKPEAKDSTESLRRLLFGTDTFSMTSISEINIEGKAVGKLLGGNVSLIENMLGTKTQVDTMGKVLFIEDVGEYLYRLDRMLIHLDRAGVFKGLAGLIVGDFTDMKDGPTRYGMNPYEMIASIGSRYDYPIMFGAAIGHTLNNMAVPVGREVTLSISKEKAVVSEN